MESAYRKVEAGDVTGNRRVDIVGISGAVMQVITRRADGTSDGPTSYTVEDTAISLAVGDFDADGRKDVAVSQGISDETVEVFLQTPGGTLGAPSSLEAFSAPGPLAAADMNLDGRTRSGPGSAGSGRSVMVQRSTGPRRHCRWSPPKQPT